MRVLVCPDKFRGTLDASSAAEAIAAGWRRTRPDDTLDLVPMADGGEGTADALRSAGGREVVARVVGPLGDGIDASVVVLHDGTAVVESARAAGLDLLSALRRNPRRTTTEGVGLLMRTALDEGARRLLVCLGGSATNDGGVGMAAALGVRFLDGRGDPIGPGGEALLDLASVDLGGLDPRLAATEVVGLVDVRNPLTGPTGASATFGPQKGADPDDVWVLERALGHLAAVVHRDLAVAVADEPGAGAAGGLGFGLLAFCGARLRPGAEAVAEVVGLEARVREADLVITGEGALDATSLGGKVVGHVLGIAALAGVPVAVVCGRADVAVPSASVFSLVDAVGADAALADARSSLVSVVERVAAELDVPV
jgi:glycerate kinase